MCVNIIILFQFIQSVTFKTTSRNLARSMWWKNVKFTVILVLVLIVSKSNLDNYSNSHGVTLATSRGLKDI